MPPSQQAGQPEAGSKPENSSAQDERRTNQIRLLQTGVEAARLIWEVVNRFWR
jgi:hypothetical protein